MYFLVNMVNVSPPKSLTRQPKTLQVHMSHGVKGTEQYFVNLGEGQSQVMFFLKNSFPP